jgi:nucleoside triphosphate pyrophosphatase
MMAKGIKLILASTSPRRREILELLKIPFEVRPPKFVETSDGKLSPEEEALLFAREKALSLKKEFPNSLIIGCDTIVEIDGKKLGKPRDEKEARAMLQTLSGRIHRVLTGLVVVDSQSGEFQETLNVAQVAMRSLSKQEIAEYIASGEPMDKAGAYAVQGIGRKLIDHFEGDYFTVVGLPLRTVAQILSKFGVPISVDVKKIYSSSGSQKLKASKYETK